MLLIKLYNGTEVLGEIIECDDEVMRIQDPFQVNYKHLSFQPMPAMSISRYMPFAGDNVFTFDTGDIMHIMPPKQAVIDYYEYALRNFQENIDPIVESELQSVVDRPAKVQGGAKEDVYKAILDRAENDGGPRN